MSGNHTLSNVERAETAWGELPGWIKLLADACDHAGQARVAERLGKSAGYVSRVLRRCYPGDYAEAEQLCRARLGDEHVMCPLFGQMPLETCITNRRRTRAANWAHLQLARACPDCPNNTDQQES